MNPSPNHPRLVPGLVQELFPSLSRFLQQMLSPFSCPSWPQENPNQKRLRLVRVLDQELDPWASGGPRFYLSSCLFCFQMIPNQRHPQLVQVLVLVRLLFPSVIPPVKVLDMAI